MSGKLVLLLNVNLDNSELTRRRAFIARFRQLIDFFREEAPIPIAMSIQGRDLEVLQMEATDFEGIALFHAPYAHAMAELVPPHLHDHLKWQWEHGVRGSCDGVFLPCYSGVNPACNVPDLNDTAVIPFLARKTATGAGLELDDVSEFDRKFVRDAPAIQTDRGLMVPIRGVQNLVEGFRHFQRFLYTESGADHVEGVNRFRSAVKAHRETGRWTIFPLDLESCYIGSHHGDKVWFQFFQMIQRLRVTDDFVAMEEAMAYWRHEAVRRPHLYISRDASKWVRWRGQRLYLELLNDSSSLHTELRQVLASIAAGSDVLTSYSGAVDPMQTVLRADRGNLTIRGSGDLWHLGQGARMCLAHPPQTRDRELLKSFQRYGIPDELSIDGHWYANQLIERCLKPRLG